MISKTLLKLIDEAILPAVLLVAAKIFGVALLTMQRNLNFTLNLKTLPVTEATLINSYSNLFSYGIIALGVVFILIKAYLFHSSHISPQIILKLSTWNFTEIITTTYELFHQSVVWLSYLWLLTGLLALQSYWKLIPLNLSLVTAVTTIFLTVLFVLDADREIDLRRAG